MKINSSPSTERMVKHTCKAVALSTTMKFAPIPALWFVLLLFIVVKMLRISIGMETSKHKHCNKKYQYGWKLKPSE